MSMTEEEAEAEAAHEEHLDELRREWEDEYADEYRREGEQNFVNRRLAAYFLRHPEMDARAKKRCEDARALLTVSYDACTVLAYSATEVGFKNLLLKPIVYGFVNSDHVADLVSTAIVSSNREETRLRAFVNLLFVNMISVDLEAIDLAGQKQSLWGHIEVSQRKRNLILHRAESAQRGDAEHAVDLASLIVEELFPLLRDNIQALVTGH
jgi:hypothetical protein